MLQTWQRPTELTLCYQLITGRTTTVFVMIYYHVDGYVKAPG